MTPEERMERLKNADRWTINDVPADLGRIPRRSPARFVLPSLAGLAAVAVAAALVIGAVNLRGDRSHPAVTPTVSPTPTATAAPGVTTGYAPPNQPFAGDCAAVASTSAMTDALGAPARAGDSLMMNNASGKDPKDGYIGTAITASWSFAARQSGGLSCGWAADGPTSVDLVVFPADAIPTQPDASCGTLPPTDGAQHATDCAIALTTNGLAFVGGVYSPDLATSKAIAQKVIAAWTVSAAATTVNDSPPAPGSWPLAIDCSAASVADTGGALWTLAVSPNHGASGPPDVVTGIIGGHLSMDCDATSDDPPAGVAGTLTYSVYGGGAWVLDQAVAQFGATVVSVPGFDHAAVLHSPDGQELDFLLVTRGPNLLAVYDTLQSGADVASYSAISEAVADALDALAK
jgi:hypothetical protein